MRLPMFVDERQLLSEIDFVHIGSPKSPIEFILKRKAAKQGFAALSCEVAQSLTAAIFHLCLLRAALHSPGSQCRLNQCRNDARRGSRSVPDQRYKCRNHSLSW